MRREEFVERSSRGHFHDEHQVLSVAQAQHANNVAVAQLVHDLRLPHHLILHQLLVIALQHFDGHVDLLSEGKIRNISEKLPNDSDRQALRVCLFCGVSSRISPEHAFLDTAEVPGAKLHLIDQKSVPLDAELPHFIWVVVGVEVFRSITPWRLCHQ